MGHANYLNPRMQLRPKIGDSIEWTHRNRDYIGIVLRPPTRRSGVEDVTGVEVHYLAARQQIPIQFLNMPSDTTFKMRTNTKLMPVVAFSKRRRGSGYEYCGIKAVHVDYFRYRDVDITSAWIKKYIKSGYLIQRPSAKIEGR